MLDHIFLPVTDVSRAIRFYENALSPLGVHLCVDFDGADGPPGHPDLKGFGKDGRIVDAAYKAAINAGAKGNVAPGFVNFMILVIMRRMFLI